MVLFKLGESLPSDRERPGMRREAVLGNVFCFCTPEAPFAAPPAMARMT
jgi:hypothetical protein